MYTILLCNVWLTTLCILHTYIVYKLEFACEDCKRLSMQICKIWESYGHVQVLHVTVDFIILLPFEIPPPPLPRQLPQAVVPVAPHSLLLVVRQRGRLHCGRDWIVLSTVCSSLTVRSISSTWCWQRREIQSHKSPSWRVSLRYMYVHVSTV